MFNILNVHSNVPFLYVSKCKILKHVMGTIEIHARHQNILLTNHSNENALQ